MRARCKGVMVMVALAGLASFGSTGCGEDLGQCDVATLGGPTVPGAAGTYPGQDVMAQSCATGRCHSESAVGLGRVGAPAGLNFDVGSSDPAVRARASAEVREHIDEIWGEVNEGAMPPPAPAGSGPLDATRKEALRNWLACGAEVGTPAVGVDQWSMIHAVLKDQCNGCHGTAVMGLPGGGFIFGEDASVAYTNVVNRAAITTLCAATGAALVTPGNPDTSLLVQKLEGTQTCGAFMPTTSAVPFAMTDPTTVAMLRAWIANGAPPPAAMQAAAAAAPGAVSP